MKTFIPISNTALIEFGLDSQGQFYKLLCGGYCLKGYNTCNLYTK